MFLHIAYNSKTKKVFSWSDSMEKVEKSLFSRGPDIPIYIESVPFDTDTIRALPAELEAV